MADIEVQILQNTAMTLSEDLGPRIFQLRILAKKLQSPYKNINSNICQCKKANMAIIQNDSCRKIFVLTILITEFLTGLHSVLYA